MPLTVEMVATGGSTIERCANEMCATANRLGVCIQVKFNGVILVARPNGIGSGKLVDEFHAAVSSDSNVKMAFN